jgi:hypothetical protein
VWCKKEQIEEEKDDLAYEECDYDEEMPEDLDIMIVLRKS